MGYGRRTLKRTGKAAGTAIARRRVRRAGKVAVLAVLAGLDRTIGREGRTGIARGERRDDDDGGALAAPAPSGLWAKAGLGMRTEGVHFEVRPCRSRRARR